MTTDRTYLRDGHGRYIFFHGVNVAGSSKNPVSISPEPSYVGRSYDFAKVRGLGFNAVRLLISWEGIEPVARGQYDEAYLDQIRAQVQAANDAGVYVLLDMHQDMYSRWLSVKYNETPDFGAPGSIENTLLALVQPYTDSVRGDGAPRWAVEACLQEKNLDSKFWGTPRILSGLNEAELRNIYSIYAKLTGQPDPGASGPLPEWVYHFALGLPDNFAVNETPDLLPFTDWPLAHALSLDVARNYACLFAGDVVFPRLTKDGVNVKEYLQSAYAGAWAKVAERVADQPNVLGYDLINEPSGNYIVLTAVAALIKSGVGDGAQQLLVNLFGPDTGPKMYEALVALRVLPPDSTPATLKLWGLDQIDVGAALGLNNGFDDNYLRPFYERVGAAILEKDPQAVFYLEATLNVGNVLGGGIGGGGIAGMWNITMTRPRGMDQIVFAPHWYPDIYPFLGFDQTPRAFTAEQVRYRDYQPELESAKALAAFSLGNTPVVFGEFGSYFDYNGIKQARAEGYAPTANILDNFYEAFERMNQSNFIWVYTPDANFVTGDGWNHEDFSVVDPNGKPRADEAWARPYASALAGKPVSSHFYSDLHYFDPDKGVVPPTREFEVRYASKETEAPTEIVVPLSQYPDGFYVWLSDGHAYFDPATQTLFHFPADDEPGAEHWVRIRPPLAGLTNDGYRYFFKDGQVIAR